MAARKRTPTRKRQKLQNTSSSTSIRSMSAEQKSAMRERVNALQKRLALRNETFNSIGSRMAADVKSGFPKERVISIYDNMMRDQGIAELQRKDFIKRHFR